MPPELSICIPAYNSAHLIGETLASVMRQGITDCEIIVVDNASDDGTGDVVKSFSDPRIRYYRNATNVGSRENFNVTASYAQGEFVKILCADDVLIDGILAAQSEILRKHPEVSLVSCDMIVTDSNLVPIEYRRAPPGIQPGEQIARLSLSGLRNYVGGWSSIMVRRDSLREVKLDSSYRWAADVKLYLEILKRGFYASVDTAGYLYRRHSQTDTEVNCPIDVQAKDWGRLVDESSAWNLVNTLVFMRRYRIVNRALVRNLLKSLARPIWSAQVFGELWKARKERRSAVASLQMQSKPL